MMVKMLFAGVILVAASAAPAQSVQQGAIGFASQDARSGRSETQLRGALFGSATSGEVEMTAAGRKERDSQRRVVTIESTAEGALLTGAGILSAAPHLVQLPVCAEDDGRPSFDCQIIKKRQKSR
jgi:hypothetical protein